MSLLENLNKLNKNISEEAVEQNNILDATKEFKKVIGAKESDDNIITDNSNVRFFIKYAQLIIYYYIKRIMNVFFLFSK